MAEPDVPNQVEALQLDAKGREEFVLDIALPVLAAWRRSVRVFGFRASMGTSGLLPGEAARIRTLALAATAKGTGIFEGATDFRIGYPDGLRAVKRAPDDAPFGIDADLSGASIAPIVSDLMITGFGRDAQGPFSHRLAGLTHVRAATIQGHSVRAMSALGAALGFDLNVGLDEIGFEPQGIGRLKVSRTASPAVDDAIEANWKDRGDFKSVVATIGAVRPKPGQVEKLESAVREGFWEARRVEPTILRVVTPGVDPGLFLQIEGQWERGVVSLIEVAGRSAPAPTLARRVLKKTLRLWDAEASFDEVTGPLAVAAAVAARARLQISLTPSIALTRTCELLHDLGARIDEAEERGLVVLKTIP